MIDLARAQAFNKANVSQSPRDWPKDPGSADFARVVARFQDAHGLVADGLCGKATKAKISEQLSAARPEHYLIANGKRFEVPFKVVTWEQDPWWNAHPAENFRWRQGPIELFILHWDVVFSSRQCHQGLIRPERNASVHLYLDGDQDATVYQSLDLGFVRAWHAGSNGNVNERSVGCEGNNRYYVADQLASAPRPVIADLPVQGNPKRQHLDWLPQQKTRWVQLAGAVTQILGIPRQLPKTPAWRSFWPGDDKDPEGSVVRGMLDDRGLREFKGVAGHYHYEEMKIDPGTEIWEHFVKGGW